jgi:hypothetical protein
VPLRVRCLLVAVIVGILTSSSVHAQSAEHARSGVSPMVGLHVPWAVGGPRIERDGRRVDHPGEWPSHPIRAIRLWDTRTAWLNMHLGPNHWDFQHLDAHVAKARAEGVTHITLVLWGTPRWAARDLDPRDAPWLGPGSASPPRDLQDWERFVRAVSIRYQGLIDAYQIGNEPNHSIFWRGTTAELVDMVGAATRIIKETDPSATIIAPGILITTARDVIAARELWSALARSSVLVDAVSFHWYPPTALSKRDTRFTMATLSAAARSTVGSQAQVWITEVNLVDQGVPERRKIEAISDVHDVVTGLGFHYLNWYAWTDLGPHGVLHLQDPVLLAHAMQPRTATRP